MEKKPASSLVVSLGKALNGTPPPLCGGQVAQTPREWRRDGRLFWHNVPKNVLCFICFIYFFFMFYLPFLSSIHEKANCIAILWTGSPHSLGSCLFRGLWATCLPHKGGGIPLSALPKDTTSELAGLFSTTSHKCRAPSREAIDTIF